MILKYTGLEGLQKQIEIPDNAYSLSLEWVEGLGVGLCWQHKRDSSEMVIAATAKESDLRHFKRELSDQIDNVNKYDHCRCHFCGSLQSDTDTCDDCTEYMKNHNANLKPGQLMYSV